MDVALKSLEYKYIDDLEFLTPCIHRIPDGIRKLNKTAYNPSMVSIGPLHRGEPHLQVMEAVKSRYMDRLLSRAPSEEKQKELKNSCKEAVSECENCARKYYAEEFSEPMPSKEFVEMMLTDGCFIIELLLSRKDPDRFDLILLNSFRYNAVRQDLLLFENQIPFLVLQKLFELIEKDASERNDKYPSLTECLSSFFEDMMGLEIAQTVAKEQTTGGKYCSLCLLDNSEPMASQTETGKDTEDTSYTTTCHILHLLHNSYTAEKEHSTGDDEKAAAQGNTSRKETREDSTTGDEEAGAKGNTSGKETGEDSTTGEEAAAKRNTSGKETREDFKYSATKLKMAGVKLKPAVNAKTLFDVRFHTDDRYYGWLCERGSFEIPPFCIYDHTEPFFRNIIAFEQSCPAVVEPYFTSLALLMDKLINSPEDVELLEEAGIIHNHLGSSEEVSVFFNKICKNVSGNKLCFKNECKRVNSYCKRRLPRSLVTLRQDYFSNPWTIISVIAAFLLFAVTVLQTVYTLLSYY